MNKDDFRNQIDFEISALRESAKTSGFTIWSICIAVFSILYYVFDQTIARVPPPILNYIGIGITAFWIFCVVGLVRALVEIITPKTVIRSVAVGLRPSLVSQTYYLLFEMIFSLVFAYVILQLDREEWTIRIMLVLFPGLSISLCLLGIAIRFLVAHVPMTNKMHRSRWYHMVAIGYYTFAIFILADNRHLSLEAVNIRISLGLIGIYFLGEIGFSFHRSIVSINPLIGFRREVALAETADLDDIYKRYREYMDGLPYDEYLNEKFKPRDALVKKIELCVTTAQRLRREVAGSSDAAARAETERHIAAMISEVQRNLIEYDGMVKNPGIMSGVLLKWADGEDPIKLKLAKRVDVCRSIVEELKSSQHGDRDLGPVLGKMHEIKAGHEERRDDLENK